MFFVVAVLLKCILQLRFLRNVSILSSITKYHTAYIHQENDTMGANLEALITPIANAVRQHNKIKRKGKNKETNKEIR